MIKADDQQYEDHVLDKVTPCEGGGWEIGHSDGWLFFCPAGDVEPRVGDVARFYGEGFGRPVRGLDIGGREVFYRTPEQETERHEQWCRDQEQKKRDDFEAGRDKLDAQYASLPDPFRRRLDGFRSRRPDFRWQHEPYEMSVCVDAAKIATTLMSADAVKHFHELGWDEQQRLVPGLFDGHSGNSFGAACTLALVYLTDPDRVEQWHGALCPLVGCQDYGCWSTTQENSGTSRER